MPVDLDAIEAEAITVNAARRELEGQARPDHAGRWRAVCYRYQNAPLEGKGVECWSVTNDDPDPGEQYSVFESADGPAERFAVAAKNHPTDAHLLTLLPELRAAKSRVTELEAEITRLKGHHEGAMLWLLEHERSMPDVGVRPTTARDHTKAIRAYRERRAAEAKSAGLTIDAESLVAYAIESAKNPYGINWDAPESRPPGERWVAGKPNTPGYYWLQMADGDVEIAYLSPWGDGDELECRTIGCELGLLSGLGVAWHQEIRQPRPPG